MKYVSPSEWKIKDGIILVSQGSSVEVVDARTQTRTTIGEEYSKDLLAIGMSRKDYSYDQTKWTYLEANGYIEQSEEKEDRLISAKLRELDDGFMWMLQESDDLKELYDFSVFLHSVRKEISVDYSQGPCLPETSVRRALALHKRHKEKEVLLLGDDDLVSPLLAKLGTPVTVLDAHRNLLGFLDYVAETHALKIDTNHHDITKPLPRQFCNRFDGAFGDPVGTAKWFYIFLTTAEKALKENGMVYIVVYPRREELIRNLLRRLGWDQQETWMRFCHYYDEDYHHLPLYDANVTVARKTGISNGELNAEGFHSDYNRYSQRPDMEYSYDFYRCRSEISEQSFMDELLPQLVEIFQINLERLQNWSRKNIIEFSISSDTVSLHILGYVKQKYVGLTLRVPQGTNVHYAVLQQVSEKFKPQRHMVSEMIRYIEELN